MSKIFAFVLLDRPEGWTATGQLFVKPELLERQPVQWLDPWNCEHQETMCAMCVETWAMDYAIWLPVGIDE
jgi:hypothetical protein